MYRTRTSDIGQSVKNSLNEIIPTKNPETIERSKFYHSQHASLLKAVNNIEGPVKEKHVRNLILGTCAERSVLPFWFNALRLPIFGNQIVCWKFLYCIHKILRDGFHTSVNDSHRYIGTLDELAKTWIHLKQGYAFIINKYSTFLVFKLKFHKKNQFIPPNLQIDDRDLNDIVSNDINNYFQLCCDFFDYLDEILGLQNLIFVTMDRTRSNSMIESGQCKLTPIIILIQESNQLYDFTVKFMFKLHDNLPGDVLEGHRERFLKIFKQLQKFYECCRNLQYFKNLITIPELPQNPPNFRVKSDFTSYRKPVMEIKEETPSEVDEDNSLLVDLNASNEKDNSFQEQQQQQYMYIQQLLQELNYLRGEMERANVESAFEMRALRDRIKNLEDTLMLSKSEIEQHKIKASNLEDKLRIMSENEKAKADLESLEKKAVSSEEKFNKMKELYNKLKDEHVALLRLEADARKQKALLSEACAHSKKMQSELEKRLEESNAEKTMLESSLKERADELQALKSEIEINQADKHTANQFYQNQIQQLESDKKRLEESLDEANKRLKDLEDAEKKLNSTLSKVEEESKNFNSSLSKSKLEIDELTKKLNDSINQKNLSDQNHRQNQIKYLEHFFASSLENSEHLIKESVRMHDDPILYNCKSGAEYLLSQLQPFEIEFSNLLSTYHKHIDNRKEVTEDAVNNFANLIKNLNNFSNIMSKAIVTGKITALTAGVFDQAEALSELSKDVGLVTITIFEKMKNYKDLNKDTDVLKLDDMIKKMNKILNDLLPKVYDINKDEIGDLIEQEMHKTSEAIEAAVAKLQSLINKSREQDTGVKLEVNDKILDNCTGLMQAIKILIMKARDLQKEIVAQGRGTSTAKEFYAKNHKWTEGLVSAAKLVGLGANLLIDKADTLVNGDGKIEEIIVCSNEIAASTAQLVVASNVKADRESKNRMALIQAKTNVSSATANLVASAKSCLQIIDEKTTLDFTNMSFHQTKRFEMESQVKVLELEKELENEKRKLYNIRKNHYKQETQS